MNAKSSLPLPHFSSLLSQIHTPIFFSKPNCNRANIPNPGPSHSSGFRATTFALLSWGGEEEEEDARSSLPAKKNCLGTSKALRAENLGSPKREGGRSDLHRALFRISQFGFSPGRSSYLLKQAYFGVGCKALFIHFLGSKLH